MPLLIIAFVAVAGGAIYLATRAPSIPGQNRRTAPPGPVKPLNPFLGGKQPTMGALRQLLPPTLNGPKIPANTAGQPQASDPYAVAAATAPSLITGAFSVYLEAQKAQEAKDAQAAALAQAQLAKQGANPTAASPILNSVPPQTMLATNTSSNPDALGANDPSTWGQYPFSDGPVTAEPLPDNWDTVGFIDDSIPEDGA